VAEQSQLFRLCPAAAAGVSLNDACFMRPAKSISLLVGAGPEARVDHYFSQCARCWMAGCAYGACRPGVPCAADRRSSGLPPRGPCATVRPPMADNVTLVRDGAIATVRSLALTGVTR